MKNPILKFLFSLVAWVLLVSYVADKAQANYGVYPIETLAIALVITLAIAASDKGGTVGLRLTGHRMETTNVVQWAKMIMKHLFKDNAFLAKVTRADEFVVRNTAVVIPQPGALPQVIKNNVSFPMVAVQRGDTIVMYGLNTYVTVPTFITLDELDAISYDKAESVYDDHFKILNQQCADDQIINWANGLPGASNVVYTSGAATGVLEGGQAGQRNTCTYMDVKKLQRLMNKSNVDPDNRTLLMEANMYDQFTDSLAGTPYKDFSSQLDPKTGETRKLFGFDIICRSSVIAAAAGLDGGGLLACNALNAALGATDNIGCFAFQKQSVELAMGSIHLFSRENDPLYTGDIKNCRIKAGGRVRRADNAGVYALMQGLPVVN
jgi:hypothetical protein